MGYPFPSPCPCPDSTVRNFIDCPDTVTADEPFEVKISVGEIPHVMEEGHFIQHLDVYSGSSYYGRVDLTPVFTRPVATLTLVKGGKHDTFKLRVVERCNLHGMWEAEKTVKIKKA